AVLVPWTRAQRQSWRFKGSRRSDGTFSALVRWHGKLLLSCAAPVATTCSGLDLERAELEDVAESKTQIQNHVGGLRLTGPIALRAGIGRAIQQRGIADVGARQEVPM